MSLIVNDVTLDESGIYTLVAQLDNKNFTSADIELLVYGKAFNFWTSVQNSLYLLTQWH